MGGKIKNIFQSYENITLGQTLRVLFIVGIYYCPQNWVINLQHEQDL